MAEIEKLNAALRRCSVAASPNTARGKGTAWPWALLGSKGEHLSRYSTYERARQGALHYEAHGTLLGSH